MAFCSSCGSTVEGQFCSKCGAAVGAGVPPTPGSSAAGLKENVACALCYLLGIITGVLFLVLAPYNKMPTVRFHAFQAIFFHLSLILLTIASAILTAGISTVFDPLGVVVWLGGLGLWIVLMVKAYNGERWKLPLIGDLAEKQA